MTVKPRPYSIAESILLFLRYIMRFINNSVSIYYNNACDH